MHMQKNELHTNAVREVNDQYHAVISQSRLVAPTEQAESVVRVTGDTHVIFGVSRRPVGKASQTLGTLGGRYWAFRHVMMYFTTKH